MNHSLQGFWSRELIVWPHPHQGVSRIIVGEKAIDLVFKTEALMPVRTAVQAREDAHHLALRPP